MSNIIQSNCSCGEPINIEINAELCSRKDKKRPHYPDENNAEEWARWGLDEKEYPFHGVTSFRCRKCGGFIADTVPDAEFETGEAV